MTYAKKTTLMTILVLLAATVIAFTGIFVQQAKAEAPQDLGVAAAEDFYTVDGAYVRGVQSSSPSDNGSGIRFEAVIRQGYYKQILTEYPEKEVKLGMLITTSSVSDINDLTVDCDDPNLQDYEYAGTPRFATTADNATFKYTQSLVNLPASDYGVEFTARAYLKVVGEDDAVYYATTNDSTRSMRSVANAYILLDPSSASELGKYVFNNNRVMFGNAEYIEQKTYTPGSGFSDNETNDLIITDDKLEGITAEYAYIGAKKYPVELEDGSLKIEDIGELTIGEEYYVSVFTEDAVYSSKFRYVTTAIENVEEFSIFDIKEFTGGVGSASAQGTTIDGYYVLKNDIDASTYTHQHSTELWDAGIGYNSTGFRGTFDGCGHQIDGITLGNYGFFGGLSTGAVVKNVAFTNVQFLNPQANLRSFVLAFNIVGTAGRVTLRDIYIQLDSFNITSKNYGLVSPIADRLDSVDLYNVVVDYPEDVSTSSLTGYGSFARATASVKAYNVYINSPTKLGYNSSSDNFDSYAGITKSLPTSDDTSFVADCWEVVGGYYQFKLSIKILPDIYYREVVEGKVSVEDIVSGEIKKVVYNGSVVDGTSVEMTVDKTFHLVTIVMSAATYRAKVFPVDKVITTAQELNEALNISTAAASGVTGTTIEGYYVLGNDIDGKDEDTGEYFDYKHSIDSTFNIEGTRNGWGFKGVFDGLGHKISGLKLNKHGVFGAIGAGAVVKNVAFTDLKFSAVGNIRTFVVAGLINGTSANKANLSDIYIDVQSFNVEEATNGYAAVVCGWALYTNFSNMIINYPEDLADLISTTSTKLAGYGSFAYYNYGGLTATNVYVISPTKLGITINTVTQFTDGVLPVGDYDSFDNEYWDMTSGKPVWKKL